MPRPMSIDATNDYLLAWGHYTARQRSLISWMGRHPLAVGDMVRIWWKPGWQQGFVNEWVKGVVIELDEHSTTVYLVQPIGAAPQWFYRTHLQKLED